MEQLIQSGAADMASLLSLFDFPLDDIQQEAIEVLLTDQSLVISAPTGAGKTAIALAAAVATLARCHSAVQCSCTASTVALVLLAGHANMHSLQLCFEHRISFLCAPISLCRPLHAWLQAKDERLSS